MTRINLIINFDKCSKEFLRRSHNNSEKIRYQGTQFFGTSIGSTESVKAGERDQKMKSASSDVLTIHTDNYGNYSNVDISEIDMNNSLKNIWWNPRGKLMGLHTLNNLRVPFIRNGLQRSGMLKNSGYDDLEEWRGKQKILDSRSLQGMKMIDVGCGGGILTEALAKMGAAVTGLDPSQELVNIAKQHALSNRASFPIAPTYVSSSIEEHSLDNNNTYDAVVLSEVIDHVTDKEMLLNACIRTLKPGGVFIITGPNRTLLTWFTLIFISEYVLCFLPKGYHQLNKFIRLDELEQLLMKLGCETIFTKGFSFNPITKYWSWNRTTQFSYAIQAVKMK